MIDTIADYISQKERIAELEGLLLVCTCCDHKESKPVKYNTIKATAAVILIKAKSDLSLTDISGLTSLGLQRIQFLSREVKRGLR